MPGMNYSKALKLKIYMILIIFKNGLIKFKINKHLYFLK